MKTVFFDVDNITRNYLNQQQICDGNVLFLEET